MAKRITFDLPEGWGKRLSETASFTILLHDTEDVEVYAEPPQAPCVGFPSGMLFPDDADRLAKVIVEAASIARKMSEVNQS
jgi:hypothetical protein